MTRAADGRGCLRELRHQHDEGIVTYHLPIGDEEIDLNPLLGKTISLTATGKKTCIHCGRIVKKLYNGGYCYPCFSTLAECDLCIVKPHECHFHEGTCRDESFGQSHCMIPHYVYLAVSSSVKVGLTRRGRQFIRWVDQGASRAVLLAELPTRKDAGELEMEIAKFLPDKTDWRKMLAHAVADPSIDLTEVKQDVIRRIPATHQAFVLHEDFTVHEFVYPRLDDQAVVTKSISMDKQPTVEGKLIGIKGQYLLLDDGVLNIKKHSGYEISVHID